MDTPSFSNLGMAVVRAFGKNVRVARVQTKRQVRCSGCQMGIAPGETYSIVPVKAKAWLLCEQCAPILRKD